MICRARVQGLSGSTAQGVEISFLLLLLGVWVLTGWIRASRGMQPLFLATDLNSVPLFLPQPRLLLACIAPLIFVE